jgi:hypothetical protein
MSSHDAPDCPICGAHTDYCHLETPVGVSIDCRDLKLREPLNAEWIASMRDAIREVGKNASDTTIIAAIKNATEGTP